MNGELIGVSVEHLEDNSKKLTIDDVSKPEFADKFVPLKQENINFGMSFSAHWVRFKIINPSGEELDWILEAVHPTLNHIEVYEPKSASEYKIHEGGSYIPFNKREINYRKNAFKMRSSPGISYVIVKFWPETSAFMFCTLQIYTPDRSFYEKIMPENLAFGIFYGALAVMFFYNLFVYLSLRDRSYLYYIFYVALIIVMYLGLNGLGFQYVWPNSVFMENTGRLALLCLGVIAQIIFTKTFLKLKSYSSQADMVLSIVAAGFGVVIAFMLLFNSFTPFVKIGYPLTSIVPFILLIAGGICFIKGYRPARFYLAAWSLYLVGVALYVCRDYGIFEYSFFTTYAMQFGTLLEVILLSFALADRINILQSEKILTQQRLMEQERKALEIAKNAQEILEIKVAERTAELEESEARFRSLAEAPTEAILIHDNGIALDMNSVVELITGWRRDDLIGNNTLDLVIAPESLELVRRRMAEKSDQPYEAVLLKKDGTLFPAEIRGSQITYRGKAARVVSLRDLTERKAAEFQLIQAKEQAEEATKLKDQFVSLVSHDLRSPMASLTMALETFKSDDSLNERTRNMMEKLAVHARSQLTLISRLLDISRLQTGKLTPRKRLIGCRVFVDECASPFGFQMEQKNISIHNTLPESIRLMADPALFGECVKNVISNAIKFSNSGGAITVYQPEGQGGTIAIRDSGMGIPQHLLPDLFKHEVRTTMPGTQGEKGTGLGLPHSYDIMKAHGGSISVEQEEGKGTTFYLRLPVLNVCVLVVDDQPAQRGIVRDILIPLKAEVLEAEHGREALEILSDTKPNLIITDINMPVMDGLTLIRELRSTPSHKDIRLIAITASNGHGPETDSAFKSELFRMGVDDFIAKPQLATDLLPRAEQLLSVQ